MQENLILTGLTRPERERLGTYLKPVTLELSQTLQEQNSPITAVFFPENCVTSTIVSYGDGVSIEVGLMGLEGMAGLPLLYGNKVSRAKVIVQIPGRAVTMRADHFLKHVVRPRGPLYDRLMSYANAFSDMVAITAACNGLHAAPGRFCRWILQVHDRVESDQFPLNQEFIAMMLGIRRASVSEIAARYKAEGLIDYSRGSMTVVDRDGVESLACECYGLMKQTLRLDLPT